MKPRFRPKVALEIIDPVSNSVRYSAVENAFLAGVINKYKLAGYRAAHRTRVLTGVRDLYYGTRTSPVCGLTWKSIRIGMVRFGSEPWFEPEPSRT
jgi:hypothetical protein